MLIKVTRSPFQRDAPPRSLRVWTGLSGPLQGLTQVDQGHQHTAENYCAVGPSGTGKSTASRHLRRRHNSRWIRNPLPRRRRPGRHPLPQDGGDSFGRIIETPPRPDLIIVDEAGFAPLENSVVASGTLLMPPRCGAGSGARIAVGPLRGRGRRRPRVPHRDRRRVRPIGLRALRASPAPESPESGRGSFRLNMSRRAGRDGDDSGKTPASDGVVSPGRCREAGVRPQGGPVARTGTIQPRTRRHCPSRYRARCGRSLPRTFPEL